ncbi:hypothetical protein RM533_03470 [Croceicoccus sp. F390]|uniref:DUF4142 domain-containing protein n=1 Tax=Croceicoccus esteveae TaxID=3075597 RepID=A0ABU2ZG93_9SPHN|nr:hypothetical protein [Croceicoccus sp. F390]MDT0575241.1 hypothetical protein [Croceicoccus sp. F390]
MKRVLPCILLPLLASCVTDPDRYASIAKRDVENFTIADPAGDVAALGMTAPSPQLLRRLQTIAGGAQNAQAEFNSSAARARRLAKAAAGAAPSDRRWTEAQVAFATLAAAHSNTMSALAELDLLLLTGEDQPTSAADIGRIVATRQDVSMMATAQQTVLEQVEALF